MFDKLNLYRPVYYILMVTGAVAAVLAFFVDPRVGLLIGGIWLASVVYALVRGFLISRDNKRFFQVIRESVFSARQDSIGEFAMPTVIAREDGEVLWTNDAYRHKVSGGRDNFCENLFTLIPGADPSVAASAEGQNVVVDGRMYSLYLARTTRGAETLLAAYLVDDHDLKTYTKEYFDSRPSVMILVIDNYSELFQDAKENERSRVVGEIVLTWGITFPVCGALGWLLTTRGCLKSWIKTAIWPLSRTAICGGLWPTALGYWTASGRLPPPKTSPSPCPSAWAARRGASRNPRTWPARPWTWPWAGAATRPP